MTKIIRKSQAVIEFCRVQSNEFRDLTYMLNSCLIRIKESPSYSLRFSVFMNWHLIFPLSGMHCSEEASEKEANSENYYIDGCWRFFYMATAILTILFCLCPLVPYHFTSALQNRQDNIWRIRRKQNQEMKVPCQYRTVFKML